MVDGAFYAQKCYAQKCYYWVRDQEKIKSNELVVIVVIDVLGIYDTKTKVCYPILVSFLYKGWMKLGSRASPVFKILSDVGAFPGGIQYRIMNPAESKLAVALCAGLRHLYVKSGTNVLYLTRDASSVVTISHLSDIVGTDGNVYVAFEHVGDIGIGIMVESLNQRSNVHILDGVDTTNAARCKDVIASLGKTINVIYCDVGRVDQVDCLFNHASTIIECGGHFVALIKANNIVYKHNREIKTIHLSEMSKLEEHRFKRVKAITLGGFGPEWCCIAGLFDPLNCMTPDNEGSASSFADPSMVGHK